MPVRSQCAQRSYVKWIDCSRLHLLLVLQLLLVLLVGRPIPPVRADYENCTFFDGFVLQYLCQGRYDREMRLLYKDRIPAMDTPYTIWQRSDTIDPVHLLVAFYDSPISSCFTLVMDKGKFYCDGQNYFVPLTGSAEVHCLDFPFDYAEKLYGRCMNAEYPSNTNTISVAMVYMKHNIIKVIDSVPDLRASVFLVLLSALYCCWTTTFWYF
ncbi:uncharacterized protein DMAD_05389 [Drosophila madeirensis]|uniref:Uncharacterized protein n=1 Tax=Drosophila madeirensis TaxID=30013 RepID=A0AAU9FLT2_DROMD|nr:uncharacterized protein LOC117893778 [Drosophila subobscura]